MFNEDGEYGSIIELDAVGTDVQAYMGTGEVTVAGGGITYTSVHYGFKIIRASSGTTTLQATNAGGSETATDTGLTVTTGQLYMLSAKKIGSTITYYVDNVLKATHTTNIPTGSENVLIQHAISNVGVATNSNLKTSFSSFRFKGSA